MKFLDFFSGIGGFRLGMEQNGHECVGHCEIDKFADKSYRSMHDVKEDKWYANDITTVEPGDLPDADCYCGGFPCQAFSIAGNRGGFEDTRGTLFFEVMRIARIRKPKYLFLENVKGLLSHDGGRTFGTIINAMGESGYDAEWQVCNSKNFGVPQNRERVFIIGHLRGTSRPKIFPVGKGNGETTLNGCQISNSSPREYGWHATCPTLCARDYKDPKWVKEIVQLVRVKEATKKGYAEARVGDSINLALPDSETRRGRVGKGVANTLDTSCNQGVFNGDRIRKLTPRECFRLQGFPDDYFDRAAEVNSDSQLYKQAGNSVTVNVIRAIAERLGE